MGASAAAKLSGQRLDAWSRNRLGAGQAGVLGLFQRSTGSATWLAQDTANRRHDGRGAWQGDLEYGDLSLTTKVASVRKSVLGMLYGNYVFSGKIDLDKTVKELGLEDREPFLPIEERATLEQLLTARSGIYLPSGNKDLDLDMPKRGSEYPGTHFVYNNWDFNAAGTAF